MTPFESLLRSGSIRTVFQPIVDLDTAAVVAHEALTRGPAGSLSDPLALFAAARREGLLTELDDICRTTALRTAITQDRAPATIFLNAEPEAFTTAWSAAVWEDLATAIASATPHLHVVVEITERDIPTRPATLLRTVDRIRDLGWGIALDDVGVSPASLAFMPLLAPDVIKMDAALVQQRPSSSTAQIAHAINDYAEHSGALLLAEGIETTRHLTTARAWGARLGQGWLFGRPSPNLATTPRTTDGEQEGDDEHLHDLLGRQLPVSELRAAATHTSIPVSTPFAILSPDVVLRRAPKGLLLQLSAQLEEQAVRWGNTCILASTFQHARHFSPATERRYAQIAEHAGFIYVLGEGFASIAVPGVNTGSTPADDPLCLEWDVAVIGPHFHAALLARDLGDDGPDLERAFEYVVTYRHDTVVAAVRKLLLRVGEHPSGGE